ncbi:MAG: hypothetical protein RR312_09230 [Bacteroidales bacterium]
MKSTVKTILKKTTPSLLSGADVYDFIEFANKGKNIEPLRAMQLLIHLYMDYCGISIGYRTVAFEAGECWLDNFLKTDHPLAKEMSGKLFCELMPLICKEYTEEEYGEYDITNLGENGLRDFCFQLMRLCDEQTASALCRGVLFWLRIEDLEKCNLEDIPIDELEKSILVFGREDYIAERYSRAWDKRLTQNKLFTKEEIVHLSSLNTHIITLMHQLFAQVRRMTRTMQQLVESGDSDFKDFCIEGQIYIDIIPSDDRLVGAILGANASFSYYTVALANTNTEMKDFDEEAALYINWWANWQGNFKRLMSENQIAICRAFYYFFDQQCTLTVEDIMKIKTEHLCSHIVINI